MIRTVYTNLRQAILFLSFFFGDRRLLTQALQCHVWIEIRYEGGEISI